MGRRILSLEATMTFDVDYSELNDAINASYCLMPEYTDPFIDGLFGSEFAFLEETNSEVGIFTKMKNALVKTIGKIVEFIKKIASSVRTIFTSLANHRGFNEAMHQFGQQMKSNPEIRKARVKIIQSDVKNIDAAIDELTRMQKRCADGKLSQAQVDAVIAKYSPKSVKSIGGAAADFVKQSTAIVTMQTAINYCKGNQKFAKSLAKELENDERALSGLLSKLSDDDAEKFRAEVQNIANAGKLAKLKTQFKYRKCRSIAGAIEQTMDSIGNIFISNKAKKGADADLLAKLVTHKSTALPTAVLMQRKNAENIARGVKRGIEKGTKKLVYKGAGEYVKGKVKDKAAGVKTVHAVDKVFDLKNKIGSKFSRKKSYIDDYGEMDD